MRLSKKALREQADDPTVKMLDLWHSLCVKKIGGTIEVMIDNTKKITTANSAKYEEFNQAKPITFEGQVMLCLQLESLTDNSLSLESLSISDNMLISHEIGHGVLLLQDFTRCIDSHEIYADVDLDFILNTMAHHPPLYALQMSFGHEPQSEINDRTLYYIEEFSKTGETNNNHVCKRNALILADKLLNCSETYKQKLIEIVEKKHPETTKILRKILQLEKSYDLLNPEQNFEFERELIQDLSLGSGWIKYNVVSDLKSMIAQAKSSKKSTN